MFASEQQELLDNHLISASDQGKERDVNDALVAGARINASNEYGRTALLYASESGHVDIVKILLAAGAAVNAANRVRQQI